MVAVVVLYVINQLLYTTIILLDILVIIVAVRTGEILRQPVLQTIIFAMATDIPVFLNNIIHDVPSYIVQANIVSDEFLTSISVLALIIQWFWQLFALLALSYIHYAAVFLPHLFRAITPRNILTTNLVILGISLLLTIPIFSPYCGFLYYTKGHYWHFDMSKPYTHVYRIFNIVLQAICVAAVVCVDGLILWKIFSIRRTSTTVKMMRLSAPNSKSNARPLVSPEMRLAINFVYLSVCFLTKTLCFNLLHESGLWYNIAIKSSFNLNLSKWAIYSLGNVTIRDALLELFYRCSRKDPVTATSALNVH